jgi:zinc protease
MSIMSKLFVASCLVALCAVAGAAPPATATAPATAPALEITRYIQAPEGVLAVQLDNGLTVAIKPVRTAPIVDVRVGVRAGSMYEGKYLGAGISHLMEHLVAQGGGHDGSSQTTQTSADRVRQIGAQSNAYTSLDHASYYLSAAASKFPECLDLMAQWIASPTITQTDFDREHGVVQRELEMNQDEPGRQLNYARMANLYGPHPAAVPVIGYPRPLSQLTYADVLDYHRRQYIPQNMILTVVGDVDADAALTAVRRAMAGFEAGTETPLVLPEVQPLPGVRRMVVPNQNIKEVWQETDFLSVDLSNPDMYPLDVLADILGSGDAGRLSVALKRDLKLVTSIYAGSYTPAWGKGTFYVGFRCAPSNAQAAESAMRAELAKVIEHGVTDEELARAKRRTLAQYVKSQQTIESQAGELVSDWISTGWFGFSSQYTDRIQKVTARQVHDAARKYLTLEQAAVTRLTPAGATTRPAGSLAASQPAASMFTMPNGLRVVLRPTGASGLVSLALASKGGLLAERPDTNGLGTLMTQLSTKGIPGMSATQIAEFFESAGGELRASCGNDTWSYQATVLADTADKALEILAGVVVHPTMDSAELEILRPQALAAIDRREEAWHGQLVKFFRQSFFAGSGYGLMPEGDREVVKAATAAELAEFHKRLRAGSSVLAVAGQFDPAHMRAAVEKAFAAMPEGKIDLPQPSSAPATAPAQTGLHVKPTRNTTAGVIVAVPGMAVTEVEDIAPVNVLDAIISGWDLPSGWLHEELRGKQLVYVVHAYNQAGLRQGAFIVYAACQPQSASEVTRIIDKNLRKAASYKPSQQELAEAVNLIVTAELLDRQQPASLAASAAVDELLGLGYDFGSKLEQRYRGVTPADVARVAQKYLGQPLRTYVTTPDPELLK